MIRPEGSRAGPFRGRGRSVRAMRLASRQQQHQMPTMMPTSCERSTREERAHRRDGDAGIKIGQGGGRWRRRTGTGEFDAGAESGTENAP